jgi:hypothetical protein
LIIDTSGIFYLIRPAKLKPASVIALLYLLPTVGLAIVYFFTFCIKIPLLNLLSYKDTIKLSIILSFWIGFAGCLLIFLLLFNAPFLLAILYFGGLFLPCSIVGALSFWYFQKRILKNIKLDGAK